MDAERIEKLSSATIREMLDSRVVKAEPKRPAGLRRAERWPFPGAVEIWLPSACYGEQHVIATLHNLSEHGLAMRSRLPVGTDTRISLAIHEPDLSVYGEGVVRHCTRAHVGYLIGVEFIFSDEGEEEPET